MDLIIFERKAFEEFATKIEQFILRVSNSPVVKGGKKKNKQLARPSGCLSEVKDKQAYIANLA